MHSYTMHDILAADVDASHEELEQQSGIGGLVFAIIVVVVILIILALLCYAQKYKVSGNGMSGVTMNK